MSYAVRLLGAACALIGFAFFAPVLAQTRDAASGYPVRAVRIVVPFGAGSGPDFRTRQLAQHLAVQWAQPVVVENRPGAGGQLAMELVAQATPDGYTAVMAGQSPMAIAPHLLKLRYDALRDFAPVTRMSQGPIILAAFPRLPVRSVRELIEHATRHPATLNAASWGTGTITHLALELFVRAAGVRITHVPYKAAGQAINELMAGQVELAFEFYPAIGAQLQAGRLRALAISGRARLASLPQVPTFTEAGLKEMESVSGWQGLAVPAGTPGSIVSALRSSVARVLALPEIQASYKEAGFETVGDTPGEFAAFVRDEHARWGKLIAQTGIRSD